MGAPSYINIKPKLLHRNGINRYLDALAEWEECAEASPSAVNGFGVRESRKEGVWGVIV